MSSWRTLLGGIAQMHAAARRHMKAKLALYWGRVEVNEEELPLGERDEDKVVATIRPPSPYDTGENIEL
jgi:hypothetical protein